MDGIETNIAALVLTMVPNMVPLVMSKRDKLLLKMRANQIDWRIEDLKTVAIYFGFTYRLGNLAQAM